MVPVMIKVIHFLRDKVLSSLGIIIIAAILVELITLVEYRRFRMLTMDELETRTSIELRTKAEMIGHTLASAEATMQEHLWDIRRNLRDADSMFAVTGRLIASNPNVIGGCIAFVPDHYPEKGRYFEPYATKDGDSIQIEQIGSPNHDYTANPAFQKVLEEMEPSWTDPYEYGTEPVMSLTTYSYPLKDEEGKIVAVCGLDIDLSWLEDTLNARQPFPSSFSLMLTQDGTPVAYPPGFDEGRKVIPQVVGLINDSTAVRYRYQPGSSTMIEFRDCDNREEACVYFASLQRSPHWQIAQVSYTDDIYAPLRRLRHRQMILIIAGLLIMFHIIRRFAVNEGKLRQANVEQARIGSELAVARNIQFEMLPKEFPPFPDRKDIDIYGSVSPAREVGGDLFDFFIRDEKLYFCIGDVSGKGVPSAMVMSVMHSLFRMISRHSDSPGRIVKALNDELSRGNETNMFVTFFLGVLDMSTGEMQYCNAGHDQPFILTDGVDGLPVKANLPLGAFSDTDFEEQTCVLEQGSVIFLFTDGLTEAKDADRHQFTRGRAAGVLKRSMKSRETDPQRLVETMGSAVRDFVNGAEQSDDTTMLAFRYNGKESGEAFEDSIILSNDVSEVERLGHFTKSVSARLSLDKKTSSEVRLALEEVVVNIIKYAYPEGQPGDLSVKACSDGKELTFTVRDYGMAFDPTAMDEADTTLEADERPMGGLGILLAMKLMDSVRYERIGNENVLTLIKSIT